MCSFIYLFIFILSFFLDCLVKSAWCDAVKYREDRIDDPEYLQQCIPERWKPFFEKLQKPHYFSRSSLLEMLADNLIVKGTQLNNAIEPRMPLLFKALELVKPEDVRVVILGQDPTPQKDLATGVAFHAEKPRFVPTVLRMFLEVAFEGFPVDLDDGDVTRWARQGVLLLNAALTCPHNPPKDVEDKDKYKRHLNIWRDFTISLIRYIGGETAEPSVWLLWGATAKGFSKYINKKHHIIEGRHPSPMGTDTHGDWFFGKNYFNNANQFLKINARGVIDWSLSSTGRNGLVFGRFHRTEKELEQLQNEEKQLRNQLQRKKGDVNSDEQKLTKMEQELEKTNRELQNTKRVLNRNFLTRHERNNFENKEKILEQEYDMLLDHINKQHWQLKDEKYQQYHIEEKIQQNRKNQQYLEGLPEDLLKRNFQKQINAIDEELNQLR